MSEKVKIVNTATKEGNINVFNERLKEKRIEAGFSSQEKLADVVGVDRVTINYYEKGSRIPDISTFIKIANALNVSCDYLLGYSNSPTRKHHETKEITGLSDKAIETINKYALETKKNLDVKKYPITIDALINQSYKSAHHAINYLLENDLEYDFFNKLENFLWFKEKNKEVIELKQDITNDDLGYTMTMKQWEATTKITVDETLFNIKNDIEEKAKNNTKDNKKKK